MVLLIGGIFIGLIAILALSHLGWIAVIPLLAAILLIAGGIGNLVNGRPDPPTPAELQKRLEELARKQDADPVQLRRMEEQARKIGADPQIIQRLEELRRKQGG
jgi:hypothetical protein